jgi:CRISPR-associated protein Cas2
MVILVTYDITNNKNRGKIHKILRDYGYPVQKSVFELMLNFNRVEALKGELAPLVRGRRDSVRFYQVCETCQDRVRVLGLGERFLNESVEIF